MDSPQEQQSQNKTAERRLRATSQEPKLCDQCLAGEEGSMGLKEQRKANSETGSR